jgi:hypothetical protein
VPVIHRRISDLHSPTQDKFPFGEQGLDFLADPMADLFEAGLQPGEDDSIIQDYVTWIRATSPSDFPFFKSAIFMPLWRHPDNPKMAELARWLFLAKDSPWHPVHELKKPLSPCEMIESPLVGVPAFRELLKREFANTATIGDFEIRGDSISIGAMNAGMGATLRYAPDIAAKIPNAKQPLRACDYYALRISGLEGSPRYELYWPEARREAARREIAKFLNQWGNAFRDRSKCFGSRFQHRSTAKFQLSPLTRPARAASIGVAETRSANRQEDEGQPAERIF